MYGKAGKYFLIGCTIFLIVSIITILWFLMQYDHMIPLISKHISEEQGPNENFYSVYGLISTETEMGIILKCSDDISPEEVVLKYNNLILPLNRYGFVRKVGMPSFWLYELRIQRSEEVRLDNFELIIGTFIKEFIFKTDIASDSYYEIVVSVGPSGEITADASESRYPNV